MIVSQARAASITGRILAAGADRHLNGTAARGVVPAFSTLSNKWTLAEKLTKRLRPLPATVGVRRIATQLLAPSAMAGLFLYDGTATPEGAGGDLCVWRRLADDQPREPSRWSLSAGWTCWAAGRDEAGRAAAGE
jgi:hypothetical protein